MTRDNVYWLSHDQVALFKTFRGTASRCKKTINHAVPRIKQPSSLLYDILLHSLEAMLENSTDDVGCSEFVTILVQAATKPSFATFFPYVLQAPDWTPPFDLQCNIAVYDLGIVFSSYEFDFLHP
ncbi:hypothetical protein Lal_00049298 [Lupinus albus]|nr:hypothetical protein Lal_00049298 [Lupinus albus]